MVCSPMGIFGLFEDKLTELKRWKSAVAAEQEHDSDHEPDCPEDDDIVFTDNCDEADDMQIPPWEAWETEVELYNTRGREPGREKCATSEVTHPTDDSPAPAMPVRPVNRSHRHREKIPKNRQFPFSACVARPVGKKELNASPKALEAMQKEWDRLRDKSVWNETEPREWDEVRKAAITGQYEVHMGYLFGICVEKNSELEDFVVIDGKRQANPLKKFKGRVVFQGDRVVN